jgi:hypothetical protein
MIEKDLISLLGQNIYTYRERYKSVLFRYVHLIRPKKLFTHTLNISFFLMGK